MNVPKIRFNGYSAAWEQRKLSDYLEVSNEKNTNDVYGKQDVLSVSGDYGIVNQIEFQGRSFAGASVSNYGVVHTDDIVYTKSPLNSNPYGIIKTNKGKMGIVSTLYAVYHPKEGTNSDFVQTYFEQHARMNNYMHPLVNKGAKNDMKVSAENALKGYVSFPNYEEQKAIAEAFSIIDRLITLHQRKCDGLKQVKKSMLKKMFPKDSEKVPEIRFDGYSAAWEQCKVGDVATIIAGGTPSTKEISYWEPKKIPWMSSGEVHKKYLFETDEKISEEGLKNSSAKWIEKGSVLIALAGQGKTRGTAAIAMVPLTTNQSIAAIKFDDLIDPYYAFQNLDSRYEELRNVSSGDGTRGGLNKQLLSDLDILFPSLEEQTKIGEYFKNIDNLITLHQRKCDALKEIKKYMLQNMFPSEN